MARVAGANDSCVQSRSKFYIKPLTLSILQIVRRNKRIANMSGVQDVTDEVKNLLLDEVTGERVSKTELKKRQKAREKDAKKAEREATRQAPPPPKKKAASAEEDDAKLNPNVSQLTTCSVLQKTQSISVASVATVLNLHWVQRMEDLVLTSRCSNTSKSGRGPLSA